jgi:hypothetical protein
MNFGGSRLFVYFVFLWLLVRRSFCSPFMNDNPEYVAFHVSPYNTTSLKKFK